MRLVIFAFALAFAVPATAAQSSSQEQTQSQQQKKAASPKDLTLTGCIARSGAEGQDLTIADKTGSYRLTGRKLDDFVGQRVQIVGSIFGKKLQIETGLKPSPNVAAQAGAIDPAQAAVAASGGSAPTGDVALPQFRVKSVRPLGAGCQ